ncbi:hypothetical protein VTH82DRAFT_6384, partial [Thermothelomyces myriococcoides]
MGGDKPAENVEDWVDEPGMHLSEGPDEEAQLLHNEDYEQFELDDTVRPSSGEEGAEKYSGSIKGPRHGRSRRRIPRWLAFLYGPDPPKIQSIDPLLPSVQEMTVRWLEKALPRPWQRLVSLALFILAWAASFAIPLTLSKGTATDASGTAIRHVDCIDTLWKRDNECGLDGVGCKPFSNTSFAFRCPADCASVRLLNPRHIGNQDVNFRPLVIGGGAGSPYRGDSFLCGAAIHAGAISDATGGCARATL